MSGVHKCLNLFNDDLMIEPCFNELSAECCCNTIDEANECISDFINLIKGLREFGILRFRYEGGHFMGIKLKDDYSIEQFCNESANRNKRDFLFSHIRQPYIDEDKEDVFYTYSDCKFITDTAEEKTCMGFYVAHLTRSFAVGFNLGLFKGDRHVECRLSLKSGDTDKIAKVCCLTLSEHFGNDLFVDLLSNQPDLPVPKCDLKPEEKKVHLPRHHGIDACRKHACKLVKSVYVKGVLNTIDFQPTAKCYISNIRDTNIVEVRLTRTSAGYGLCVATTAENIIQNHWIAKYLKREFGG